MLRNYLKTAIRNLLNNKFYSLINIAGLTIGLAIGIMILLWVQNELSFDSFHKKTPNIYRLELFGGSGTTRQIWQLGVAPIGPLSKQELPQIEDYVRINAINDASIYKYGDKVFAAEKAAYADPSLFSVFDFTLIRGNPAKPFPNDNSVVITQKAAEKYFGAEDPLGKVLSANGRESFTVSGVIKDFPDNSSINYDMILPFSYLVHRLLAGPKVDLNTNFMWYGYETYLLLKPGTDLKTLAKKINQVHLAHKPEDTDADYLLLPMAKLHLYNADLTDKGIGTVRIFMIVAVLILVIACINYVNLSTARSMLRAKEISMRKILGAAKWHLFTQFIVETALLFLLAGVLAIGLIFTLMPVFSQLSAKQLAFNLGDYHIWLVLLATIAGTLVASSIYPALLLSSFEPLKALKGKISAGVGDVLFRKILIVTQFVFSIVLIVGTIVITNQLNYIRSKDLGYDRTNVFTFDMRGIGPHYDAVRAELLKQPGILDVTRCDEPIVNMVRQNGTSDWDGKPANSFFIVRQLFVDKDFIPFFKMKMAAGRAFSGDESDQGHFILNEAALKEMNLKDPIGKRFWMGNTHGTILGVVKDFHFASMKEKIGPTVLGYEGKYLPGIYIKTTGRDAANAIKAAEGQFKQYNGKYPFSYHFLDDIFNNLYKGEQTEGKLFNYFAAIAIFISCLGLFGLAAYTAQVRTREIGVRKVLGASISRIVGLLAQDFVKLVFVAIVIATPLAWLSMYKWLQAYAYRISISWWVFVVAGLIAVIVALVTISFQSIKAARAKPVKSLRAE